MVMIDFIWAPDCPNVAPCELILDKALKRYRTQEVEVCRWLVGQVDMPVYCQGFGSPTILVNGDDVDGASQGMSGSSCRVYRGEGRLSGVPSLQTLTDAIDASLGRVQRPPC